MLYRFAGIELDCARRELRVGERQVPLQPLSFAVLQYLVERRERVVSKAELLGELWSGVRVGEASLQRAISLVRSAINDDGSIIVTHSKHGYRFRAEVSVVSAAPAAGPEPAHFVPRFARSDDVFIAYHTLGEGALDIVLVPGWVFPMQAYFELPAMRQAVESLAQLGRVILFDKRGTGLSDRAQLMAPLEQRVDDLRAVLDAVGSKSAVLIGFSEAGPLCLLFASLFPERTRGLILAATYARFAAAYGYPHGWSAEAIAEVRRYIESSWGKGDTLLWGLHSHSGDPSAKVWAARAEQTGASPGAALQLLEALEQIDVRPLLASVTVPTVVVHAAGDRVISVENARYLAAQIAGARLIEVAGEDHFFVGARAVCLSDAVAWVSSQPHAAEERFLTSVLALAPLEPGAGASELLRLDAIAAQHRGARAGRALVWSFDGPQRAIRCGQELARSIAGRVGVHTGEVSGARGAFVGAAVDVACAIAASAAPGQVLVSTVVRDLVYASHLAFAEHGSLPLPDGRSLGVLVANYAA
ncbi:MAG TPA: alpha/beta fold hydrolase [Polyangiaceae bacterium]|nr:alpha/beta fold hydrolase [Polyangiaceae bacterium]